MAREFGIPLAEGKTCLPNMSLEFLGIQIDTYSMEFRLPEAKLVKFKSLLALVLRKRKILLKEMQSILGVLAFACRIMPVGRIFSRQLYLSIAGLKSPFAHIRLTSALKEDLLVWNKFLEIYNGRSFFQMDFVFALDFSFFADATGSKGFGVVWKTHWCCAAWPDC